MLPRTLQQNRRQHTPKTPSFATRTTTLVSKTDTTVPKKTSSSLVILDEMQIILLNSVETFLESLDARETAKVIRTIELLEEFGNELEMPHSKHVTDGLLELRIRGRREIKIFYSFHRGTAILLHAFVKKSQKTPSQELARGPCRQR